MPATETMHEDYIKSALSREWVSATCTNATLTLKEMCLKTTSLHMDALDKRALDLPTSLLKDLLPHLNIVDLDRIHQALKLKGISTSYVWAGMLRELYGKCIAKESTMLTEDEWKQKAMEKLFTLMFYGYKFINVKRYLSNVNFQSLLLTMAKYVPQLCLRPSQYIVSFTAELWPVLSVLEKGVRRVQVANCSVLQQDPRCVLYVLHRILDHGIARNVIMDQNPDPGLLAWILHGRGPQSASHKCPLESMHGEMAKCVSTNAGTTYGNAEAANCQVSEEEGLPEDEEDHMTPCKRQRLSLATAKQEVKMPSPPCQCIDHEQLCRIFNPSAGPTRVDCPQGQIQSLEIWRTRGEVFNVLVPLLPSWLCLCSLSLHSGCLSSPDVFEERDVLRLAQSLKQLYETSSSSLTDLSVSSLPHPSLMETLLNACPNLRSFSMEIHPIAEYHRPQQRQPLQSAGYSELLLEKLSVKLPKVWTNLEGLPSVLKRSPNLTSLHVAGIQSSRSFSHSQFLNTVSESNRNLRKLNLEDINLADCHSEIINLLENCMLEELSLKDCRLLEKCSEKEDFLRQLVDSVKRLRTLQSLNLSQNRLAKNVTVLGELFTGTLLSTVKDLDISSNFIQPPELEKFGMLLETNCPPQQLTLDLRRNPLDRDPVLRDEALHRLGRVCRLITDQWNSRDTMADHLSVM